MKYFTLLLLLAVSAFAGHRFTITCDFEATAKGYKSFKVSEEKIYAGNPGQIYNDDGDREDYWGMYQRYKQDGIKNEKNHKCKYKISVFPNFNPTVVISDGKANQFIVLSKTNFIKFNDLLDLNVTQVTSNGDFHCTLKEGWN